MKKVLTMVVVLAMTLVSADANAQVGAKFGIKGGVNFSNMSTKNIDTNKFVNDNRKFLIGYNIGLTAGINFHENFGFEAGLIFNSKGLKYNVLKSEIAGIKTELERVKRLHYLDIPVSLKGMYNVSGVQIYGKFGPYISVGLTGKNTTKTIVDGKEKGAISKDVEWDKESKIFSALNLNFSPKRFDYGLQMGAGVEVGGFLIEGIYKFSLADVDNLDNYQSKHHVLAISVGYNLGF